MLCLETGLVSGLGSAADAFPQESGGLVNKLQRIIGKRFFAWSGRSALFSCSGSGCLGDRFLGCSFLFVAAMR